MVLVVMGGASALVGVLVSLVFEKVATDMGRLTQDMLPQLEVSATLTDAAGLTRDSMANILLAANGTELDAAQAQTDQAIRQLKAGIERLPQDLRTDFETAAANASGSLTNLLDAREASFDNAKRIEEEIDALQSHSRAIQTHLFESAREASEELSAGGENTIALIGSTLATLVDEQFGALQSLLEAQADINLLAGMSVGLGLVREVPMKKSMKQTAEDANNRLTEFLANLDTMGMSAEDGETIRNAVAVFENMLSASRSEQKALRKEVLAAREASALALTGAIKKRIDDLGTAADESGATNRDAVQSLLDNEVGMLNKLLEINTLINSLQLAALRVVSADDLGQVNAAVAPLQAAAKELQSFAGLQGGVLDDDIQNIASHAVPEQGLVAARKAVISARNETVKASQDAAEAVGGIAHQAAALSGQSQGAIAGTATAVTEELLAAEQKMFALLGASAVVLVLSILLTRILVTRPLAKISGATERLAAGDLSQIKGFDRAGDEIRRIAGALSVFRDSIVERDRMTKANESERQKRQAAQTQAVTAIGEGLERLSQGDLSARIETPMSEGYEKLRQDFNATLDTLSATVREVVGAAGSIRNGAAEITQASDDLSRRTESQAATLEQTAAALEALTDSVKSAADGAKSVEVIVNEAQNEAEVSGQVVQNAVSAMTEIEDSARKISQIIGVIDDISFQTNLLALNAGVEAARAGEAGRGFAVVASEVRALAQRSSAAADEIKVLIGDSSKQVENGVELVGKAGGALTSIVNRVSHISQLVSEIAAGAGEQSTGLGEINSGMSQLDQVTQQNAAMVEEATAASHLLNSDADTLSRLVANFTVESSNHYVSSPSDPFDEEDSESVLKSA
ncbi:methyl-accepting chemotaxis protein [Phaeobacter sp. HF9A]|uniref:methyl-accepting chemotaxis protein n=1 Tax=Phaeobacter sp. HF9A TaxID=2721561 RepID=UPI0020CA455A|nr:methyl-accepting chemotaxis protein [Phaeobacter sp. HF9A]